MREKSSDGDDRKEPRGLIHRDSWDTGDSGLCNCIVIRDGKLLLLRRSDDGFLGGQWDIPGGKLDPGEEPECAAARELCEETGLRAASLEEAVHYSTKDNRGSANRFHIVTFRVVESDSQAKVQVSEEHPAFRWVTKAEYEKLDVVDYVQRALVHCDW